MHNAVLSQRIGGAYLYALTNLRQHAVMYKAYAVVVSIYCLLGPQTTMIDMKHASGTIECSTTPFRL
jgi:hypothetical protein